jgi:AcrR family transcriptional regulator
MSPSTSSESSAIRSRRQTEKRLKDAIDWLQDTGTKVSISAVAKAAEVTPALIHNTYPDIAEQIRSVIGKTTRSQRDAKHEALVKERERNRELRAEVDRLRHEVATLASINLTLLSKLAVFGEISTGKVVSFSHPEIKPK